MRAGADVTQTIAAGTSAKNLPTESTWAGAQNPPYVCCWNAQGQYVTFAFTTTAGTASFGLRYSAGNGAAGRKIELDGVVIAANQVFPATANWSTWTTVTLSRSVTAASHTLKVWFDAAAGSNQYINLDNLSITTSTTPTTTTSPTTTTHPTTTVATTTTPTTSAPPTTQKFAAGTSAKNLPTESTWAGAQNPPYVCCWNAQGQYVTFAFTTTAGTASFGLRYSAGNGAAGRKIELDGVVIAANQVLPATANWSTWTTVTLSRSVTAASHTLKVWFDAAAGSNQYINLDNLTVTTGAAATPTTTSTAPAGNRVAVSVGYVDGATGLNPWQGSANTTYIGGPAQCCATHGPNNGANTYDSGAIEIANPSTATVTVNAVTVDFGGGSTPSHFDLWGGGTAGRLPLALAPGRNIVLSGTGFNFDTSDLNGEACNRNSRVVPVVHVTVNGVTTDYQDSRQILNTAGVDLATCPGNTTEQVPFTQINPGAQPAAVAVNAMPPAVVGTPMLSRVLSGLPGAWRASPPPAIALQWLRCSNTGATCALIAGATAERYVPIAADVGSTLRLRVNASNVSGAATMDSAPTPVIQTGPNRHQFGDTSTGQTAYFFSSGVANESGSFFTAGENGTTTNFEFYARGAGNAQTFTPKVYAAANGVRGALIATGAAVSVPRGASARWYVSTLPNVRLAAGNQYLLSLAAGGAFNGTYVGAENNGQLSVFVDHLPG
ncbi:MAG TPA: carbohydrate-binding protein [Acidimicrobiia bacterium]|nr:carbohydrate-binding protein [Acidimicrobiia bacterium]